MSLASIFAFLSVLVAFGVPQPTIDQIHDILIPPSASTTSVAYVPVITTPITENQPIYFGSVAPVQPVNNIPKPMVQSIPMDNSSIALKDITAMNDHQVSSPTIKVFSFEVRDTSGTIVTNQAPFTILVDGNSFDTSQTLNAVELDKDRNVKYGKVFHVDAPPNSIVSVEYNGVNYLSQ